VRYFFDHCIRFVLLFNLAKPGVERQRSRYGLNHHIASYRGQGKRGAPRVIGTVKQRYEVQDYSGAPTIFPLKHIPVKGPQPHFGSSLIWAFQHPELRSICISLINLYLGNPPRLNLDIIYILPLVGTDRKRFVFSWTWNRNGREKFGIDTR
jgi:hypothetical protein